jgi:hypothetical protein
MVQKFLESEIQTMEAPKSTRYVLFVLFTILILLLSACQSATLANSPQPTQPRTQPAATLAILVTEPSSSEALADITLDYSAVAQDVTVETVPAKPTSADSPYWEAMPGYRLLTLQGYPTANHMLKPQIFIYPVGDLASANENADQIAADLQALLQTRQGGDHMPFLPIYNAAQVIHVQVQYLDFKSGQGVRFLTQFDQGILPINNFELIYTFQGLTGDGKYYIAAVLPVTHPELPDSSEVNEEMANDFQGYLSGTVTMLNQQPANSFTPDLDKLDALVRSIEVK